MLEIGKIVNTHGLKGEMRFTPWCDGIEFLKNVKKVFINDLVFELVSVRPSKNVFIIKLKGVDNINDTDSFINKVVYAKREDLPELPENTFYIKDLIGLKVYNGEDFVGEINDVFSTPANDVYVVKRSEGKDILIPAIKQIIKNISIGQGRVDAIIPEEYFNEN